MAAFGSRALREQLAVIMGALTTAAVAEICDVVDEGFAVLRMEISRSHQENEDLKKKLHLIQSIVVRGSGGAEAAARDPEVAPVADGEKRAETPRRPRDGEGGDAAASSAGDGGGVVMVPKELPDVVLIKDEDSDSNDAFEEDEQTAAEGEGAASGTKRRWPGPEAADRKSSGGPPAEKKTVYSLDSPPSEPGFSGRLDAGEVEAGEPEYAGLPPYFGGGSLAECPTDGEPDLGPTWTKQPKGHAAFTHFHPSEDPDGDAFGLKMVSVTGSIPADCQLSDGSGSAFEYEDGDALGFARYGDPAGGAQLCGGRGKRYVCPVCSKTYATSQNLEVHMRIHTGERPFCCSQCGKKFTQSAHLKSHLSVHSGERPHTCTLCSRSFIVKYSLKLHMRKCHDRVLPD
ncbi:uncharacterized protein ACO6RY_13614 [Pungitius sinensis]